MRDGKKSELTKKTAFAGRRNRVRQSAPAFRAQNAVPGLLTSFTATEAKNEFGRVFEKAIQGHRVVITKHDTPKAVLLSIDEFNTLSRAAESKIDTLAEQFDSLLARMQGPRARKAMDEAFHASPKQLGRAAVAAARKRG